MLRFGCWCASSFAATTKCGAFPVPRPLFVWKDDTCVQLTECCGHLTGGVRLLLLARCTWVGGWDGMWNYTHNKFSRLVDVLVGCALCWATRDYKHQAWVDDEDDRPQAVWEASILSLSDKTETRIVRFVMCCAHVSTHHSLRHRNDDDDEAHSLVYGSPSSDYISIWIGMRWTCEEENFPFAFSSSYTNMNFHFLSHRFFEYISLFPPLEHRTMGFRLPAFLRLLLLTVRWKYRFSVFFPSTSTPFLARHLRVLFCHRQEHEKRSKKKKKKKKKKLDGHFMSSVFSRHPQLLAQSSWVRTRAKLSRIWDATSISHLCDSTIAGWWYETKVRWSEHKKTAIETFFVISFLSEHRAARRTRRRNSFRFISILVFLFHFCHFFFLLMQEANQIGLEDGRK